MMASSALVLKHSRDKVDGLEVVVGTSLVVSKLAAMVCAVGCIVAGSMYPPSPAPALDSTVEHTRRSVLEVS